jgi:hypothetical protein
MGEKYKEVNSCRVCNSGDLVPYLNLGQMPLVNSFITKNQIPKEEKFPLEVLLCQNCYLSQLSIVIDPSVLFRDYVYQSSISRPFVDHCENFAAELNGSFCEKNDLVLDIASNDGCLLRPFKAKGNRVLGVDPARNLAEIANESGIETIPEFWDCNLASKILSEYGPAKIITAFNVFAHVADIHSFVCGVKTLLSNDGFFILESPHMHDLIGKNEFDTIYHEHLSYLLLGPLQNLMKQYKMKISRVEEQEIHGGSIRVYVENECQDRSDGSFEKVFEIEKKAGLYEVSSYINFRNGVASVKNNLVSMLRDIKGRGKSIGAFGASAKGNILLNYCGVGDQIDCIYDHTPEKQGKLTPGTHIPVKHPNSLLTGRQDYLLLTAWNFAQEIMRKTKAYKDRGGKYIVPIPQPRII